MTSVESPPDTADIAKLHQRIAELEEQLSAQQDRCARQTTDLARFQTLVDALPYAIYWKDTDLVYGGCNKRFADDLGLSDTSAIIGKTDVQLPWQPGEAEVFRESDRRIITSGQTVVDSEETVVHSDGLQEWFETYKSPLRSASGEIIGLLSTYTNITERRRAEETVQAQTALLQELSTPVIPVNEQILVMPLIGTIDSRRAQQVLDTLLTSISAEHARIAILDITGVPVVDTQVANALLRAAQAVKLLGAQAVITGIRPEVAQTLVGLGVDLRTIVTRSSLQSGIAYALGDEKRAA